MQLFAPPINYTVPLPEEFRSYTETTVLFNISLIICVIFNPLGTYLIVYHTPPRLKILFWQTLLNHSINFASDFYMSFISRPKIFFPVYAGETNGVIRYLDGYFSLFGYLFFATCGLLSIGNVILWKHHILLSPSARYKFSDRNFYFATSLLYFCVTVPLYGLFWMTYEPYEKRKLAVAEEYPRFRDFLMQPHIVPIQPKSDILCFLFFLYFLAYVMGAVCIGCAVVGNSIMTINRRMSSKKTRDLELRLFFCLIMQFVTPVCLFAIPGLVLLGAAMCGVFNLQDFGNIFLFVLSMWGFFGTMLMIGLNESYRKPIRDAYYKMTNTKMSTSSRVSQVIQSDLAGNRIFTTSTFAKK